MKLRTLVFILQSLAVSGEYFYLFFRISYDRAVDGCKKNGLQLANLKTSESIRQASAYIGEVSIHLWSGLHYNASLSKFQWGDGEVLHSAAGLSWQGGQPDLSQGMECAYMKHISGSFIYKMSSCRAAISVLCVGEPAGGDFTKTWPSFLRYTKRNSTESNKVGSPECVFERRGISGQVFGHRSIDTLDDCAVTCKEDARCIYFIHVYLNEEWGGCIIHKRVPG